MRETGDESEREAEADQGHGLESGFYSLQVLLVSNLYLKIMRLQALLDILGFSSMSR